jgi:hypothetical protein
MRVRSSPLGCFLVTTPAACLGRIRDQIRDDVRDEFGSRFGSRSGTRSGSVPYRKG